MVRDIVIGFRLNLELRNNEGHVPLWLALSHDTDFDPMDEDSLAARLIKCGASPDAVNNINGQLSLSVFFTPFVRLYKDCNFLVSFICQSVFFRFRVLFLFFWKQCIGIMDNYIVAILVTGDVAMCRFKHSNTICI